MGDLSIRQQTRFNAILFNYLLIFVIVTIVAGSLLHYYLTKKLTRPIQQLIESAKQLKKGEYPQPVEDTDRGEVGELTAHFNSLINQLKSNDAGRKKLVSDISHELRTPLTNLNGYLKALEDDDIQGDADLYHSLLNESRRITEIVEQMELLKEWGGISLHSYTTREKTDIAELISQCADMFRLQLDQKNIPFTIQVESYTFSLHSEGIQQVITNLMDNAINHYQGDEPLHIEGAVQNGFYHVSVRGPGETIPGEEKHHIFERFYRLDTSRSRKTGGSGLGLAIAREIIEAHNGRIGVTPKGNTNTFWFDLPVR